MWQQLVETALLGTGKRTINPDIFPENIRNQINIRTDDLEQSFMEIAGLSCFYLETGKLPQAMKIEENSNIIEENLETAPQPICDIFNLIENVDNRLKEALYHQWFDLLIKKQMILSPEIIIKLIYAGNRFSDTLQLKIMQVIGNKGKWILKLHTGTETEQDLNSNNIWLEGNSNDRKNYLNKLLETSITDALKLLGSTWNQEPLVNKKAFIEILKDSLNDKVISFAENLYKTEFSYKAKEKKTEKECRKLLVEILLQSNESELYKQTLKKLFLYFNKEKKKGLLGFISSKSQAEYQLPAEEDAEFWNAPNMEQIYGFETKNYDISLFKTINQYWLSLFIELIPANAWLDANLSSNSDFLNCFLENDDFKAKLSGKTVPIYLDSILKNAIVFEDNPLTMALLNILTPTDAIPILKNLKPAEFENFIQKNRFYTDYEMLQSGPYHKMESWSLSFSQNMLLNIYESSMLPISSNLHVIGIVIAKYIHTDAYDSLQKYHSKASLTNYFHQWNVIYEPVNKVLQIRKLINYPNN